MPNEDINDEAAVEPSPIEVVIKNKDKKDKSPYDSYDDEMNDALKITEDEIKEFEKNDG